MCEPSAFDHIATGSCADLTLDLTARDFLLFPADPPRLCPMKSIRLTTCLVPLLLLAVACAPVTTPFVYKPTGTAVPYGKGLTVQVGKIQNNLGFQDPKAIRFNVLLDRPFTDAVHDALIAELQEAGFTVGPSNLTISVIVESSGKTGIAYAGEGLFYESYWTFGVYQASDGRPLFSKKYTQARKGVGSIWDTEGQIGLIRKALMQFVNDPEMQMALRRPVIVEKAVPLPLEASKPGPASLTDVELLPPSAKRRPSAYAVVFGIEQYREKLPKADFADRDAFLVGEYLTRVMGFPEENVVVRTNDKASLTDVRKYIENWLPNNVEKGSSVFIYYSGHGAPNSRTGDAYLVPYDGDPSFVETTSYPLKQLYAALDKLPARDITVVLDSCFSGAGGRSVLGKGVRPMVLTLENQVVAGGKTVVLAASQGDQVSSTYDQKGHGLLTYYFLKGLQGEGDINKDGVIDMAELYEYVKPNVQKVARKQYNNEQTPQLLASPEILRKGGGRLIERQNP